MFSEIATKTLHIIYLPFSDVQAFVILFLNLCMVTVFIPFQGFFSLLPPLWLQLPLKFMDSFAFITIFPYMSSACLNKYIKTTCLILLELLISIYKDNFSVSIANQGLIPEEKGFSSQQSLIACSFSSRSEAQCDCLFTCQHVNWCHCLGLVQAAI